MKTWTGETRSAAPGWRAARLEDGQRVLVPVASWGVPRPNGDLVPLGADGVRLDGPTLLHVAPSGMSDEELWRMLERSAAVAAEIEERMRREEAME